MRGWSLLSRMRVSQLPAATIILLFVIALLTACASLPLTGAKEPSVIAIRNNSGADIREVTLREPSRSVSGASRFGSISPVPAGVTQLYVRPSDPPALPKTISVEWVNGSGITRVKDLSMSPAFRSLRGTRDEAIVFEFGPADDIQVFVETIKK